MLKGNIETRWHLVHWEEDLPSWRRNGRPRLLETSGIVHSVSDVRSGTSKTSNSSLNGYRSKAEQMLRIQSSDGHSVEE